MRLRLLPTLALVSLLLAAFAPGGLAQATPAKAAHGRAAELAGLLNPDGTLRLGGGYHGALDLSGWNVHLDPQRGPVFGAAGDRAAPAAPDGPNPPAGQWANVGSSNTPLNAEVDAIAITGTTVYLGGVFHDADGLGDAGNFVVKWNGSAWSALDPAAKLNGIVDALAVQGSDVYVGGFFSQVIVQGVPLTGTAYIARWNGAHWSALGGSGAGGSSLGEPVHSIAISGTAVYAGGEFTDVVDQGTTLHAADNIAKWDAGTGHWSALGSNGGPGDGSLNGMVRALAIIGGDVYAGGDFTDVNDSGTPLNAADYIARWDGSHWAALNSNGHNNGSLNGPVHALAADGGDLYVGGEFVNVQDGIFLLDDADYLARWDGAWHAVGGAFGGSGSLNAAVQALAVSGANLYVGGDFTDVVDNNSTLTAADKVVKWNGTHWSALGNNGTPQGALAPGAKVAALAADGAGNLYVGGNFDFVNNGGVVINAADVAKWTGASWAALPGRPNGALENTVSTVAVSGTDVYVGGFFQNLRTGNTVLPAADYVARWDAAAGTWSALGSNGAGDGALNSAVEAIVIVGPDVYVGGQFTNVDDRGTPLPNADYVAMWDGAHWHALGWDGVSNGSLDSDVHALAADASGHLYVGGQFTNVNDSGTPLPAADEVARWDANTGHWSALGSNGAGDGSLNFVVSALAVSGSDVYVGGGFSNVNDSGTPLPAADYVARWNANTGHWLALGSNGAGNGALNGGVGALLVSGSDVFAAGSFTNVNDNGHLLPAADYVAEWDGSHWSALGSNGAGDGALNGGVGALASRGPNLYVSGAFTNVNDNGHGLPAADYVAQWDGHDWSALGSDGAGNGALSHYIFFTNYVSALATSGNTLYVGGSFEDISNSGTVLPAADFLAAFGLNPLAVYLPLARR